MKYWIGVTLIDITETGIKRGDTKERNQQRNWESVLQVLGLKTQPIIAEGPIRLEEIELANTNFFGSFYEGTHSVWGFKFASEQDLYDIEHLEEDFDQVPVILGLDETARFMLPIFHSNGTLKNIHFLPSSELNIS